MDSIKGLNLLFLIFFLTNTYFGAAFYGENGSVLVVLFVWPLTLVMTLIYVSLTNSYLKAPIKSETSLYSFFGIWLAIMVVLAVFTRLSA